MRIISTLLLATAATAALSACSEPAAEQTTETVAAEDTAVVDTTEAGNIVAVAQGNESFSTLVTAVTAAGLGETLSGAGPFTVFAPTNDAFAKVDATTLSDLLKPENKEKLAKILTYHVVSGNLKAADVAKAITDGGGTATLTTVEGGTLKAMMDGDKVVLEDANGNKSTVTMTDVAASNGTIHAIDTVVMPKA